MKQKRDQKWTRKESKIDKKLTIIGPKLDLK